MTDARLHPLTGLRLEPVGYRRNGTPIWPVLGAAEDDPKADDDKADTPDDDGGDDDPGADPGLTDDDKPDTVEYWKKRSKQHEARNKQARLQAREARAALAAAQQGKPDEDKPDPEAVRKQVEQEVNDRVLRDRVVDKIEAKATKFADPEDAVAILMRSHEPDDFLSDGKIDVQEIKEALDELLEQKPHLAAQGGKRAPAPDPSQGAKPNGGADKKPQLTRSDMERMSPQDIVKAQKEGRFDEVLGAKP